MRKLPLLVFLCLFAASCSSFMTSEQEDSLRELESYEYIMRKAVAVEKRSLAKNQAVKLNIAHGDDYIKVYAYPASIDVLKADSVLIVYLFEEDFPGVKFDLDFVLQSLDEFVARKK